MGRQNSNQAERNGDHNDQRSHEGFEPTDHQDVNQDEDGTKGQAQVAENLNRDMPLSVPFHGGLLVGERHGRIVNFKASRASAVIAHIQLCERLIHFEDGVDGAFHNSGDISYHIGDWHQVFVVNAFIDNFFLNGDKLAQRDQRRAISGGGGFRQSVGITGANPDSQELFGGGLERTGDFEHEVNIFLLAGNMEQVYGLAAHSYPESLGDGFGADAVEGGLLLIHNEAGFRLIGFHIPIHIDDSRRVFEDFAYLSGQLHARGLIGSVDFGYQCLENRRSGRNFCHGNSGSVFIGDFRNSRANAFGDIVALGFAFVLFEQVDLKISHTGALPCKVMTDQAVEIERRGRADIDLIIGNFGFHPDGFTDFQSCLCRFFQSTAFGHIQDDLKLILVIKGEHLDLDPSQRHEHHGGQQEDNDSDEEHPP